MYICSYVAPAAVTFPRTAASIRPHRIPARRKGACPSGCLRAAFLTKLFDTGGLDYSEPRRRVNKKSGTPLIAKPTHGVRLENRPVRLQIAQSGSRLLQGRLLARAVTSLGRQNPGPWSNDVPAKM